MRALYIETRVAGALELLWRLTQDPASHQRWDLRFTSITDVPVPPGGARHFRYATRVLPGCWLAGDGVFAGQRCRPDGSRTSVLRFRPDSALSPLGPGSGYWRYIPTDDGVRFLTGYDYRPGWGRLGRVADVAVRPLVGWATAWSFDRLRLWVESGLTPERSRGSAVAELVARVGAVILSFVAGHPLAVVLVACAALLVPPLPTTPAARRCRRRPARRGEPGAPILLSTLEGP